MKNYRDIANAIFERRDRYVAAQKKKKQSLMRVSVSVGSVALVALMGFELVNGSWFRHEPAVTDRVVYPSSTVPGGEVITDSAETIPTNSTMAPTRPDDTSHGSTPGSTPPPTQTTATIPSTQAIASTTGSTNDTEEPTTQSNTQGVVSTQTTQSTATKSTASGTQTTVTKTTTSQTKPTVTKTTTSQTKPTVTKTTASQTKPTVTKTTTSKTKPTATQSKPTATQSKPTVTQSKPTTPSKTQSPTVTTTPSKTQPTATTPSKTEPTKTNPTQPTASQTRPTATQMQPTATQPTVPPVEVDYIVVETPLSSEGDPGSPYKISAKIPNQCDVLDEAVTVSLSYGPSIGLMLKPNASGCVLVKIVTDDGEEIILKSIDIHEFNSSAYFVYEVWGEDGWPIAYTYSHTEMIQLPLSLCSKEKGRIWITVEDEDGVVGAGVSIEYTCTEESVLFASLY